MLNTPQFMREMKRGEETAVDQLLEDAFGRKEERILVEKLRSSKAIAGEMILPMNGEVVGYAALSLMLGPKDWLLLEPIAILPEHQARGFGKRLLGMIAQWAEMTGNTVITRKDTPLFRACGFTPLSDHFEVTGDFDTKDTSFDDSPLLGGKVKTSGKFQGLKYPKSIKA